MGDLTMALKRLLADDAANLKPDEIEALIWGFEARTNEHNFHHGGPCDCETCDIQDAVDDAFKPVGVSERDESGRPIVALPIVDDGSDFYKRLFAKRGD